MIISKRLTNLFLSAIFLCALLCSHAHGQKYDSLRQNVVLAQEAGVDSIIMEKMFDLAFEYFYNSSDSAQLIIAEADRCLNFAKEHGLKKAQATAMNLKAVVFRQIGRYESSHQVFNELIEFCDENNFHVRKAQMMDNKANVYMEESKYDEALALRLASLSTISTHGDSVDISTSYEGISSLYIEKDEFRKGIEYANKSLKYLGIINESKYRDASFNYGNMALSYKRLNMPDSALFYFLKCRASSKDIKYLYDDNEAQLGNFYLERKEYGEAIKVFEDLIGQFDPESKGAKYQEYVLLTAWAYFEKGDIEKATNLFEQIDTQYLKKQPSIQLKYGKLGYRIKLLSNDYEEAFEDYKLFRDSNDSLKSVERNVRFEEIETKYNVAEKERVISKQQVQLKNRLLTIGALLSALVIGMLFFYQRGQVSKFEKKLVIQENKFKAKEIESLKRENKLISMQSMLDGQEEERRRIAQDLHDNIGSLMSTIKIKVMEIQRGIEEVQKINLVGEVDEMINQASNEVRRISHNMTPVAMELTGLSGAVEDLADQLEISGIRAAFDLAHLDEIKDKKKAVVLYRILQELISNVAKHSGAKKCVLKTKLHQHIFHCSLHDDGLGISEEDWDSESGLGLKSIKNRVEYLDGIILMKSENGTHIDIEFPI